MAGFNTKVTPEIERLTQECKDHSSIDLSLYGKYDVKRGLRDINGKGVLAGLTQVSNVQAVKVVDGKEVPCAGSLYYRGYNIKDLTAGFVRDNRFGFEETTYLLLYGKLPDRKELEDFQKLLANQRSLPTNFVRDVIMKAPGGDIMNALSRSVLTLYSYDENPDDISVANVLRQSLQLIGKIPLIAVYAYLSYRHFGFDDNLYIRTPDKDLSIAENILQMVRQDGKFTELEAKVLDIALVIHAEHGGGNNSTFTDHVVTSSGTDTYAAISAALGSLKGPRHGGANKKVSQMFDDMKRKVKNWEDEDEVESYLIALLNQQAFDRAGLIYGMGHAVYSISDPRARTFRKFVQKLADEKGLQKEFALYNLVEKLAPKVIANERHIYKGVSANIDFYSGLVYSMLGIPHELYTPIFAIGRIAGWSAHRLEELVNAGKIIRPAYKAVAKHKPYTPLSERD